MLPFVIIKYLVALTILIMLSCDETNAQLHFNILSFNNNMAGSGSLNGNGNAGARPSAVPANQQQGLLGTLQSLLGSGLSFLVGSFLGTGLSPLSSFSYGYYPYYSYGYYYPYYRGSNYRSPYNYYPYYYYYRG
ncbi:unnamed protein product [Wuchereria bancrofti]|uniref:Uncharacterized protein n=1 Tax=Wuchereria bancrofti TaxID=6293 RepID=A0A3P7E745_WUCBA|nr:unnamed protein product [Wuchereria bancrofti]